MKLNKPTKGKEKMKISNVTENSTVDLPEIKEMMYEYISHLQVLLSRIKEHRDNGNVYYHGDEDADGVLLEIYKSGRTDTLLPLVVNTKPNPEENYTDIRIIAVSDEPDVFNRREYFLDILVKTCPKFINIKELYISSINKAYIANLDMVLDNLVEIKLSVPSNFINVSKKHIAHSWPSALNDDGDVEELEKLSQELKEQLNEVRQKLIKSRYIRSLG